MTIRKGSGRNLNFKRRRTHATIQTVYQSTEALR